MKDYLLNFYYKTSELRKLIFLSIIVYSITLIIFTRQGIPAFLIIRDLAQFCGTKLGVGFISNLGIILWVGISFILIFVSKKIMRVSSEYKRLIITGTLFSSFLALDDFFLIHDKYIMQEIIFFIYFLFAFYLVKKCLHQIIKVDAYLFFASYLFFGFSMVIDIVLQDLFPSIELISQILEEGFKFSGIFCWFFFWWKTANILLKVELKNLK